MTINNSLKRWPLAMTINNSHKRWPLTVTINNIVTALIVPIIPRALKAPCWRFSGPSGGWPPVCRTWGCRRRSGRRSTALAWYLWLNKEETNQQIIQITNLSTNQSPDQSTNQPVNQQKHSGGRADVLKILDMVCDTLCTGGFTAEALSFSRQRRE